MSEELKLLPCPVCGDTSVRIFYNDDNVASVGCRNCQFETRDFRREESAIRVWNSLPRRADIERVERERDWLARQLAAQSGHSVVYWRKLAHRAVEGE